MKIYIDFNWTIDSVPGFENNNHLICEGKHILRLKSKYRCSRNNEIRLVARFEYITVIHTREYWKCFKVDGGNSECKTQDHGLRNVVVTAVEIICENNHCFEDHFEACYDNNRALSKVPLEDLLDSPIDICPQHINRWHYV